MLGLAHLEGEPADGDPVAGRRHRRGQDVDVLVGQHPGDVGQQPVRSSASTWIATRNTDADDGAHSTSTIRSGSAASERRRWCSRCGAPRRRSPRVTKPRIASPGTGVQQRASLTQTSLAPLTTTPGSPAGRRRLVRARHRVSAMSSTAPSGPPSDCDQPLHHRLRRDVALADRRVQRGDVGVAQVAGERGQRVAAEQPLQRQALLAHRPDDRVLALLDRVLAALLGEPLPDLGLRARRWRRTSASRGSGRRARDFEVKISTVSPLSSGLSSGTSRPLTRAPMQRWPTSVCTA